MSLPNEINPQLLASSAGGYNLTNSLRFRRSASAWLSRTPATTTNRRTYTLSAWVKLGQLATSHQQILRVNTDPPTALRFEDIDGKYGQLRFFSLGSSTANLVSTAFFRDPSAWYHVVLAVDTTQATSSNRVKMYVNGVQITAFDTAVYPDQNFQTSINLNSAHGIGATSTGEENLDGYLAEFNFIDGQALTPSSFGATNEDTGVWQPKKYAGSYGTNGFYLPFTDNSALTTSSNVGLGKDFSGNGNYWTTNNISITAGVTYDSMTDVPTLTSATASNFPTWNPLEAGGFGTYANGNLLATCASLTSTQNPVQVTVPFPTTGSWYCEVTGASVGANTFGVGIMRITSKQRNADTYFYAPNGSLYDSGTSSSYGASWTNNDVIGIAVNMTSGFGYFYKNNVSQGMFTFNPEVPYNLAMAGANSQTIQCHVNFGQRPFAYTPPTGFVALNTFNLPEPTIGATETTQANKYFDVSLYTGNASALTVSGLNFSPDLVWIKPRDLAYQHQWYDTVRGALKRIGSSSTAAENTETETLKTFTSNGFTLGNDVGTNPASPVVAWNWKANGTGVSNTDGSNPTTVSANTSAGFSVVTYDGASAGTFGHGLGVAPKMIIVKRRSSVDPWVVWHTSLGSTEYLYLNSTAAKATNTTYWNSESPTSSVFSLGLTNDVNAPASNYVAYCFAEIAGYSKFGRYTGNGSADGTFVYTGFRPAYVMIKRTDSTANWLIGDYKRMGYNGGPLESSSSGNNLLQANTSNAETGFDIDYLSNGFKLRNVDSYLNGNGATFIFMAFAETPFKYSLAR
jgi:hypothetical protein